MSLQEVYYLLGITSWVRLLESWKGDVALHHVIRYIAPTTATALVYLSGGARHPGFCLTLSAARLRQVLIFHQTGLWLFT